MGDSVFDNVNWFNIEDAEVRFSVDFGTDVLGGENITTLTLAGRCSQIKHGFSDIADTFGYASVTFSLSNQKYGSLNIMHNSDEKNGRLAGVWFPVSDTELDSLLRYFAASSSENFSASVQYSDQWNLCELVNAELSERMKISVSHVRVGT